MPTVDLSWDDNSSIEDGFKVYRSKTENPSFPSDYTEIADLGADTTTYTDTTAPLTKNYYAVVATNQTAETDPTKTSVAPFAVGLKLNGSDVSSVSVNGTTVSLEDIEIY